MRKWFFLLAFLLLFSSVTRPAYCEYERSYHYYMGLGIKAYEKGYYKKAVFYFEAANAVDPANQTPLRFINLIKRIQENRVEPEAERIPAVYVPAVSNAESTARSAAGLRESAVIPAVEEKIPAKAALNVEGVLDLDDALWQKQPNTELEIELDQSLVLRGKDIERFLLVDENYAVLERLDKDRLRITAQKRRGSTFLHVWDEKGRWTFHLKFIIPLKPKYLAVSEEEKFEKEEYVEPFKFTYSNNYSQFYSGNNLPELKRLNLTLSQYLGLYGDTPYGAVDASATYYKFEETTERVGQSVGLTDGKIGPFEDFTIRGYDTFKRFSEFSLPGRSFRGALVDAYAFDHNIHYSILRGQDRAQFFFLTPASLTVEKSYIEGGRVTAFPDTDHEYSLNYVRGYGPARADFLKEKVFSADTRHRVGDFTFDAEVGSDEDVYASRFNTLYQAEEYSARLNLRNIEKDFNAITGPPVGQGEIGGELLLNWQPGEYRIHSDVDVYQDRQFANRNNPDGTNVEANAGVEFPLDETTRINSMVFYTDTPQLLSPRTDYRINNKVTKILSLPADRSLTVFLGNIAQQNRSSENAATEFDRYSVYSGFQLPIVERLYYYLNYDYSWVEEKLTGVLSHPQVLNTGLSHSRRLTDALTCDLSLSYRNEENTDGAFSFLSGEDSVRGNVGLSYRPSSDFEIFMDSQLQNIIPEDRERDDFIDFDIRLGVRSSWDLPFAWNPIGEIRGVVYKDIDGNALQNKGETGMPGIKVNVGNKVLTTDKDGNYLAKVRAKKVRVGLDVESIPEGFISTTALARDVVIENGMIEKVNFGLNSHTSIYGAVFWDRNNDGYIGVDETLIPKTKIILDDKNYTYSGADGSYIFDNVTPAKHTISFDVNTLPAEYLPLIRLRTEIEVSEGTTYIFHIPVKKQN